MRNLTPHELIKIIPLEKETRAELLRDYDSYNEDKRVDILMICWKAFGQLKDKMQEIKYQQFLLEVEKGERKLTQDFMYEVNDAVWEDIEEILQGKREEKEELDDIRKQLQTLMIKK